MRQVEEFQRGAALTHLSSKFITFISDPHDALHSDLAEQMLRMETPAVILFFIRASDMTVEIPLSVAQCDQY